MPTTTTNLGLNKTDTTSDGQGSFVDKNDYFNFDTDLNDNWDKIDAATGDLSELETTEKNSLVGAINEVSESVPDVSDLANKDLSNLSATGESRILQTFCAIYGTTTAEEIQTALDAGKIVYCSYSNHILYLTNNDSSYFYFVNMETGGAANYYVRCQKSNSNWNWNSISTGIRTSSGGSSEQPIYVSGNYTYTCSSATLYTNGNYKRWIFPFPKNSSSYFCIQMESSVAVASGNKVITFPKEFTTIFGGTACNVAHSGSFSSVTALKTTGMEIESGAWNSNGLITSGGTRNYTWCAWGLVSSTT